MVEYIVDNDFAGGEIPFPGIDEVHALGRCLLHIESFLLHLSALHDVVLSNGVPFDAEAHSIIFGADQRAIRDDHLKSGVIKE